MEGLFLLALALLAAGPVLAIVALVRASGLAAMRHAISNLTGQVEDLERAVRVLRRRLDEAAAPPHPTPPAVPAPAPPPAPILPPAPPAARAVPAPVPAPVPPAAAVPPPSLQREISEPPPRSAIEWERWVGIRGAALLGAVVLALAGLLFFQFSIQHGLITPALRVVVGLAVGLTCVTLSEWLRPRQVRATPEALAGAGIVILYAALWAAHALYGFVPLSVTFLLMVLVTATCGLLAIRHASRFVAVLGLIGGFATPLLLRSETDRPIGLFGYVLLLDLGLLAVGHRKRWPWLGVLALAGTVLMQGLWIGFRMGPERVLLGLVILGVFALLFAASRFVGERPEGEGWDLAPLGALLFPFAFAIYFAARIDLGPHLWPMALFLGVLSAGASWVARRERTAWLGLAAAAGSVGVFAVWRLRAPETEAAAWESAAIALGLSLLFHFFVERERDVPGADGPAPAAILAAVGTSAALIVASVRTEAVAPWPWLAGWLGASAVLFRHAAFAEREPLQLAGALVTALGLALQHLVHGHGPAFPGPGLFLAATTVVALAAQAAALVRRGEPVRAFANHAAAAFPAVTALSLVNSPILPDLGPALALGASLGLGILVLLAGTRLRSGWWTAGAMAVTAVVHGAWTVRAPLQPAGLALGIELLTVALFTAWPLLAGHALRADRLAWYAAALAGPLWFFPARSTWIASFGDGAIGLLPLLLGALALAAAARARRLAMPEGGIRLTALVWLSAVAISFTSLAIPLQLEKSWITIGWALEGLALVALWKRLDHPGLKWLALAHLAAATARLVPVALVMGYHPRSSPPVLNWVLYTYLVPAAALFASARLLARQEAVRAREWERALYGNGRPIGAIAASVGGILVVFLWLNLAIADWFGEGPRLVLEFGRSPARDLTVSLAWALYAMVLLGFGMMRRSSGLRWLSLAFLVVTFGKVFLYDMGELRDLYRIVSLVGLALSLLSVSLLYQRFVFRKAPPGLT